MVDLVYHHFRIFFPSQLPFGGAIGLSQTHPVPTVPGWSGDDPVAGGWTSRAW